MFTLNTKQVSRFGTLLNSGVIQNQNTRQFLCVFKNKEYIKNEKK